MKGSMSYLLEYLIDRRDKCLNSRQESRLHAQSESSTLEIVGECERCLKLTYASFLGASWDQVVST